MKEELQQNIERLQLMLQEHHKRLAPFEQLHRKMKALFASTMMQMGPRQRSDRQFALQEGENAIKQTKDQIVEIEQLIARYVVILAEYKERIQSDEKCTE